MSATINWDIFRKYYSNCTFNEINIGGQTNYDITWYFLKKPLEGDYLKVGVNVIKDILKEKDDIWLKKKMNETFIGGWKEKHIIFFVTSQKETEDVCFEFKDSFCTVRNFYFHE